MTDNKLREIQLQFERIISKAGKLKANKRYTDEERTAIIKALKKEFSDTLLSLEFLTEDPTWRERAFEVQESFCLKAKESGVIKTSKELEDIFKDIYEVKKAATEDGEKLKAIKNSIDKAISERDLSKLAHIWYDILELPVDELSSATDLYIHEKLLELELVEEVENLLLEIRERAKEKRFREEELELRNHEARLRALEREHKRELKKEYAAVGRKARTTRKSLLAEAKEAREEAEVHFESPGFCQYCHKKIDDKFYHYNPRTKEMMHSSCYELYKSEKEREEEVI